MGTLLRLRKEASPLVLPAGAVATAAILSVAASASEGWLDPRLVSLGRGIGMPAFYVGLALVGALSFGSEFQQRTLPLLLSQPVGRTRIWFEKWVPMNVALSAVAIVVLGLLSSTAAPAPQWPVPPALYVVAVASATPFWTLLARSTIGGFAFSLGVVQLIALLTELVLGLASGSDSGARTDGRVLAGIVALYSAATLGAGFRMFTRLEVSSAAAFDADAEAGRPGLSWLRCRPASRLGNLVRKELRLQRPTFLLAGTLAAVWVLLLAVAALNPHRWTLFETLFFVLTVSYAPLQVLLCGGLAGGEEAALGVREWQLTVPVSARTQWCVKLVVALGVAVALVTVLLSLLVSATSMVGSSEQLKAVAGWRGLPLVVFGVVIGFWASTLLGHTVRGVLGAVVAIAALVVCASVAGFLVTTQGVGVEAATELLTRLMVRFQLPPEFFAGLLGMGTIPWPKFSAFLAAASLFGVILLLAGGQSLAGFRRARLEEPVLVRYGVALALAAFISAGAATLVPRSAGMLLVSAPVRELRAAIRSAVVLPDDRGEAAEGPIELGTLADTGLLSERTRAWLAGSHVRASGRRVSTIPARVFYDVRVRLASGREFRTTFLAPVKP